MGGKKRKIAIERINKKAVASVAFTKRRAGLFSKASELCLLSPNTQIAILATPPSSNSHASFYSFGHSSVDHVVSSLLHDQANQFEKGFWWEDECFERSENVDELKEAANAVSRMLNNARVRLDDVVKNNQRDSSALVIRQFEGGLVKEEEEDLQYCNTNKNKQQEMMMNQIPNFEGASGSGFGSLFDLGEDGLRIDDFYSMYNIEPL